MFASLEEPSLRSSVEVVLSWKVGSAERVAGGLAENESRGWSLLGSGTESGAPKRRELQNLA